MGAVSPRARLNLLYACALGGGALLAYITTPPPSSAGAATVDRARALTRGLSQPPWGRAEPAWPGAPEDPMGRRFAGGKIIGGETRHRLILFSFDDGPDRRTTPLLLDRLDAEGVHALFFLTASRIAGRTLAERQRQNIARRIATRGHLIGSHTLDHAQLPLLNDAQVVAQLRGAERVFEEVFDERPFLFRPPGGARSARVDRLIGERGYTTVLWNLGAGDFQVRSADEVFDTWRRVFERRQREHGERGGIILLHDTYPWSVDAFQMILAELRRRNCTLLAQGKELYDVVDDLTLFFEPADPAHPDAPARPATPPPPVLRARQHALRETARARCAQL